MCGREVQYSKAEAGTTGLAATVDVCVDWGQDQSL